MDEDNDFDYGCHWATGTEPYDRTLQRYIRKQSPGEPTYDLCKVCTSIDFDAIKAIDYATVSVKNPTPLFLFPEGTSWFDPLCPFCRLMGPFNTAWQESQTWTSSCRVALCLLEAKGRQGEVPGLIFSVMTLPSTWMYSLNEELLLYQPTSTPAKQCALASTRHLHDTWLAKELNFCETFHAHQTCKTPILGMRLLDCITMAVLAAPATVEYLALSYVWSKYDGRSYEPPTSEKTSTTPSITPTISDAAELTLRLGKQFLWVDRLCIDQDNLVHRRQQIASMTDIYRQAWTTIVMLDGDDSRTHTRRFAMLHGQSFRSRARWHNCWKGKHSTGD